jgi:predicted phosphoribosyltransferase
MSGRLFRDRRDAGRVLAGLLERYQGRPEVTCSDCRVAEYRWGMKLPVLSGLSWTLLVRKLGLPGREELAMGAIAILVDDGLATGASMRAAIQAVWRQDPSHIVIAVPAAAQSTCDELALMVDEVVCATTPAPFLAVGASYWDFTQVTDDDWGAPVQRRRVRPALVDSVEALLHDTGAEDFLLSFATGHNAAEVLSSARRQWAIGVVYRPQTEAMSHYFRARMSDQFDAVIHLDMTSALQPLERTARWDDGEPPETDPFAV